MSHLAFLVALLALVLLLAAPAGARPATAATLTAAAAVGGDKININTADVKQLMTLTGVGRSLAERIVQYREAHGSFKKPEDLRKVEGVGGGLWERNRERIVVK
jgi:competence ComEA-like helix-hairpin-helix protein